MPMTVTIAPCAPTQPSRSHADTSATLLEIAQAMSDDCDGHPIHILGRDGQDAAVVGQSEEDVELF